MKTMVLITALLSFSLAHAQEIRDGQDLLRAMHDRYKNSWYQTVTFKQKSTTCTPGGSREVLTVIAHSRHSIVWRGKGIAGLVLRDLKTKKIVNRSHGNRVICLNPHPSP